MIAWEGIPEESEPYALSLFLKDNPKKRVLYVTASEDRRIDDTLRFFCPTRTILNFPAWDTLPYDRSSPHLDVIAERLNTLMSLDDNTLIVTSASALLQKIPPLSSFKALSIEVGTNFTPETLSSFLTDQGFQRRETVYEVGEFALRGGIMDVFPPGYKTPFRLDYFGDTIESIRAFDPLTQLSQGKVDQISFKPMSEILLSPESISLFRRHYRELTQGKSDPLYEAISQGRRLEGMEHWLPLFYDSLQSPLEVFNPDLVILEPQVEESLRDHLATIQDYYQARLSQKTYFPLPPEKLFLTSLPFEAYPTVQCSPFGQTLQGKRGAFSLDTLKTSPKPCLVVAESKGRLERLKNILAEHGIEETRPIQKITELNNNSFHLAVLPLERGFLFPSLTLVTEQDLLGTRLGSSQKRKKRADKVLAEASQLSEGDYVVHVDHGVGQYQGLQTLTVEGSLHDFLLLVYEGGDKLFVPVENLELLSRYGSGDAIVSVDKLGSAAWQNKKAKAKKKILEVAHHLVAVAAERAIRTAPPYATSQGLYEDFCARFPYGETEDQLSAIEETLADLTSGCPMDRLICGDVGFGKTEVAMRAAFTVASQGDQVAVVVPTTLLARQHYHNFVERFKHTGLRIGQLSRFVSAKDMQQTKEDLKDGKVDIVISTHSIFSKSVSFSNLGLMILDEEQHFGVAQKEHLKNIKKDIHILTLTATPIPRTLQMALSGVRDMSLITTPPIDRLAVRTFVLAFDPVVLREALLREHFRGGQSFYVCPYVEDIGPLHEKLKTLVPELKIAVAHGQLPAKHLEDVMMDFYDKKYDLLLATNIIESGIDVSSANTLIIHRADRFGLAQLYQLRGRVGRSKTRAYAYLTYQEALTENATKRLEVMQSLDSLGAGFTLASYDLDIRGAGNLVGEAQSGHIKEVGIELYQQMLEEAVAQLKDNRETTEEVWSPQLNLGITALIPETYVSALKLRLSLYRRLSDFTSPEEVDDFVVELTDRFGTPPEEVHNLLGLIKLKILCKEHGINKIDVGPKGVLISYHKNQCPYPDKLMAYTLKNTAITKIRPDHKVFLSRAWAVPSQRLRGISLLLKSFLTP